MGCQTNCVPKALIRLAWRSIAAGCYPRATVLAPHEMERDGHHDAIRGRGIPGGRGILGGMRGWAEWSFPHAHPGPGPGGRIEKGGPKNASLPLQCAHRKKTGAR
jgi:hypothetical protein